MSLTCEGSKFGVIRTESSSGYEMSITPVRPVQKDRGHTASWSGGDVENRLELGMLKAQRCSVCGGKDEYGW